MATEADTCRTIILPKLYAAGWADEHLDLIDAKHDLATSKRNALQDLFRTLLHELMTAKTRVHNLEINA
jgi:type I restriction enzyme S subunit